MAKGVAKSIFFFLSLFTICCSGTLVGFSYDARRNSASSSSLKTISFLKKNDAFSSQIRVFVADHRVLGSLSGTGISVDYYVDGSDVDNLRKSKASAISWLRTHLIAFIPHINVSSIIVSSTSIAQHRLHLLLPTLKSIHLALKSVHLDHRVKISIEFPLSTLENSGKNHEKYLQSAVGFIRKYKSFIVVEAVMDGELSLGDGFVQLMVEKATYAATVLHYKDIPMVLNVKSTAVPSAIEVAEFTKKMVKSIGNHAQIRDRIYGLFAEISPMEGNEEKELNREEEEMFPSSHRQLLLNNDRPISSTKTTLHDSIYPPTTVLPTTPITNPVTTPVTVPFTNPSPTIITVPAVLPTSPLTPSISNPITVPVSTPVITVPSTNPVTPPAAVPITIPVTAPMTPPLTNPVTTYPISPPGSTPSTTTPVIFPMPPPATSSPVVSGQGWCVAKSGVPDTALQVALDYACGVGGADCSAIQQTGSCYNPNTLVDHASFAFNSYYQKNSMASSCDFGGSAMMVNTNPSSGNCIYPSSSSSSTPSSSSSVLNTDPTSSTTIFAPQPPAGISSSSSILVNVQLLFALTSLTAFFIMGNQLLSQ